MKELTTDHLFTIGEIVEDADLVSVFEMFKNTTEKDSEKVGMQVLVKMLAGISKHARTKFYVLMGELTETDAETVKNQSIPQTVKQIKELFTTGENGKLIKDFFG